MNGKSALNKMKRGYFKLPIDIIFAGLSSTELAVYMFMASCGETFNPSIRIIAKRVRISKSTAIRSIKALVSKNIIKVIERGELGNRNKYQFVAPIQWVLD